MPTLHLFYDPLPSQSVCISTLCDQHWGTDLFCWWTTSVEAVEAVEAPSPPPLSTPSSFFLHDKGRLRRISLPRHRRERCLGPVCSINQTERGERKRPLVDLSVNPSAFLPQTLFFFVRSSTLFPCFLYFLFPFSFFSPITFLFIPLFISSLSLHHLSTPPLHQYT